MALSVQPESKAAGWTGQRILGVVALVGIVLVFLQGLIDRAWLIHAVVLNSDEAADALQAEAVLHGHFYALFWGAHYGGTQPYLTAALFSVLPHNGYVLRISTLVVAFVGTFFVWKVARASLSDAVTALAVTAISFTVPMATIYQLTYAYGFRVVAYTMVFASIFQAIRIYHGRSGIGQFAALGLLVGVGWWSNPEIVYSFAPIVVLVVPVLAKEFGWRQRIWSVLSAGIGFLAGSLPWWWNSLQSGFATLSYQGGPSPISQRVSAYVHYVLPMQFGLKQYETGLPLFARGHHVVFYAIYAVAILLLAGATISALHAGGVRRAIGAATLASPFIYVASPANIFWNDGRYAIYLTPLYVLTFAIGAEQFCAWARFLKVQPKILERSFVVAVLVGTISWSTWQANSISNLTSLWSSQETANAPAQANALALERGGYRVGWADYWTAYQLDFESGGRLAFSPTPNDVPRDGALLEQVMTSTNAVWLVVDPSNPSGSEPSPGATAPGGVDYQTLLARLHALGVSTQTRRAGNLWVVIPSRPVQPSQLDMGSASAS